MWAPWDLPRVQSSACCRLQFMRVKREISFPFLHFPYLSLCLDILPILFPVCQTLFPIAFSSHCTEKFFLSRSLHTHPVPSSTSPITASRPPPPPTFPVPWVTAQSSLPSSWSSLSVRLLSSQTGQGKLYWSLRNARVPLKVKVNKSKASFWTTRPKPDFSMQGINYWAVSSQGTLHPVMPSGKRRDDLTGKLSVGKTHETSEPTSREAQQCCQEGDHGPPRVMAKVLSNGIP